MHDTLAQQLKPLEATVDDNGDRKQAIREPILVNLCDYDNVEYNIVIEQNELDHIKFNVKLPCYKQIQSYGAETILHDTYKSHVSPGVTNGYDITLLLPLNDLSSYTPQYIDTIASIKTIVMSGVYIKYFNELLSQHTPLSDALVYSQRNDTIIYIIPKQDRVIVVYELDFTDSVDKAIARIFMQEFVDSKRRLGAAPPVTFNELPPLELQSTFNKQNIASTRLGYLSFAVMLNHVESGKIQQVATVLTYFRNYLQYHIKSSKTYFHARMRARVVNTLKLLNRAKQQSVVQSGDELKNKKTISGKTFVRQP